MEYTMKIWTNESWTIGWKDKDTVGIVGPYQQSCFIDGGDFEGVLAALCAAYKTGRRDEKNDKEDTQ